MKKFLGLLIKKIYKGLMILVYRPKVVGRENMPKDTAAIVCPNHVHALDSTLIISMNKRHIKTLAKEELFRNKFFKFYKIFIFFFINLTQFIITSLNFIT